MAGNKDRNFKESVKDGALKPNSRFEFDQEPSLFLEEKKVVIKNDRFDFDDTPFEYEEDE